MKPAQFRIVHFMPIDRYVAIAWNYDIAVFISTRDHASYGDARAELQETADKLRVHLKWFDGEYICNAGSDAMVPRF